MILKKMDVKGNTLHKLSVKACGI